MAHTSRIRLFPDQNEIREGQVDFYNDAYETAENGKILFAYAPTGSGKTIASLSGLLESALPNNRKVIFLTTRITHHKQAIDEIRRINQKSKKGLAQLGMSQITAVDKINKADMCYFPSKYGRMVSCDIIPDCEFQAKGREHSDLLLGAPMHANEAIGLSKRNSYCAHSAAAKAMAQADVVVCDYSYLFKPDIRQFFLKHLGVGLSSCDVIIDEAHNLVDRIRELNTLEITPIVLKSCLDGLSSVQSLAKKKDDSETVECAELARHYIHRIEKELMKQSASPKKTGAKLTAREIDALILTLEEGLAFDSALKAAKAVSQKDGFDKESLRRFRSNTDSLELLQSVERVLSGIANRNYPYGAFMEKPEAKGKPFGLQVVPFDAALFSKEIFNSLHSAVLMSGTLPKKDMFRELLGIDGSRIFETGEEAYPSPFDPSQQPIFICSEATTRQTERDTEGNMKSMVGIITDSAMACHPDSVAIFYPSYEFMESVVRRLDFQEKPFAVEMEAKGEKREEKEKRQKRIESMAEAGKPMVFHAVIGGSSNEGVDFFGKRFKLIMVAGFPHPTYNEKQQAYERYLDWKFKDKGFGGYEAAVTTAMIKTDQAIGRGIRTASDYCACLLIERRFAEHRNMLLLPVHLREYARKVRASDIGQEIKEFMETVKKQN